MTVSVSAEGRPLRAAQDSLEGQFETISDILYATAGIRLTDAKRELVRSRLTRRLRQLGGGSVKEYVAFVQTKEGRDELTEMVDILTTNKTSFFRESPHFDFLRDYLESRPTTKEPLKLWSAGCSSGEEPYTMAMVLAEYARARRTHPARILATDISDRVLQKAKAGEYDAEQVAPVPAAMRQRYLKTTSAKDRVKVSDDIRKTISFGRLNLMGPWPMKGPFDAIFCRNVMIYFDQPTRETLVERFARLLAPGGYLFVGHSESLSALKHTLEYVQPAVYKRQAG